MRLLPRKVINKLRPIIWLVPLFLYSIPCLAEDENPYLNLSTAEASGVLNRLVANPILVEKLSDERKGQLTSTPVFQRAVLDQQVDLLTKRNLTQSALLKKIVLTLYGTDSEVRTKFEAFAAFSERLEYLIATGNISALIQSRQNDDLTGEQKRLLDSSLLGFVRSAIAEKLADNKSSQAVELLILVPDELWAKEGSSLATQVFSAMVKDSASFSSEQVDRFSNRLSSLLESDPTLKPALLGIFEISASTAAGKGEKAEAQKLLDQIRKFFDNKLPPLFVEQLLLDHSNGLESKAVEDLIAELKEHDGLSPKFKLKLMWDGYFGPFVPILVGLTLLFICVSIVIGIFVFIKSKLASLNIDNPFRNKKIVPGYMRPIKVELLENEDEYTRLLALFNLSDTATENEIKRAYRNRMKQLHPDSGNSEISLENSGEFRDLKHAYDRLIDIRAAWFKGRKDK